MDFLEDASKYFLDVYKRIPIKVTHGEGVWLYADDGQKYLDLLAGIAVNALGYNHPLIKNAILTQLDKNLHLSNFFVQGIHVELAKKLLELTPFEKVFFSNSGTEAIEGLLKIVKKWGNQNKKYKILTFEGSFHGRTLGAATLTGQEKYRKNFLPLLPNVEYVAFNDTAALKDAIDEETCAVFFEGISGEGGIREISSEILNVLEEGRKKYSFLIIADEIQTGVGRTGVFYNFERYNFVPDAIATAKGLGGGLPLGAFLVSEKLATVLDLGEHGTTYGGNPLACASGLAAVRFISDKIFLNAVVVKGAYFKNALENLKQKYSKIINDVRGQGLMLGVEVRHSGMEIMSLARKNNLIFSVAGGGTVLRFVPPLILETKHIDQAIEILDLVFSQIN
jgi:acetylornithine/N-succinyldiaminopimelate aminotransferase